MRHRYRRADLHEHIVAVMDETSEDDPFEAVRIKARALVTFFHQSLGETPPFNVTALASLRGLHWSDDDPRFSPDSEIAPEADGRVVLRINRNRPPTRQRFSICHEIGHTLFPDYHLAVRCRKRNERMFADPADLLETLCDVAASEMMFPTPWFTDCISSMTLSAQAISQLASDYQASRDATVRRLVELHSDPLAAVFFSWKLKPTEKRQRERDCRQAALFDDLSFDPEPKLRVDYAITNPGFDRESTNHIPRDKSVPSEGPIFDASVKQACHDGECWLDLGSAHGRFGIHALPIYTAADALGPDGACSVVAVLCPK